MAKIAFILLCHKDPEAIIQQAKQFTAAGDYISIHFDARAPKEAYDLIRKKLYGNPNVVFANKRIKCGWGEWSLVQATLHAIEAAVDAFPRATHFYMVSGDCMSIKSAKFAHQFLDANDVDYVESFDFFDSDWIKTGLKEERLIYRHWFNERTQKRFFYWSFWAQRKLGITRPVPSDIQIMIGSQWWCLRRRTIEWILNFVKERKDVVRFFKTTWIPDETFFQTLVRHLVPAQEIKTRTLTFLMFTDYGMPLTFYNDHYDLLISQDGLFARKISPEAAELKSRLGKLYASEREDFNVSKEGRNLFKFLTGRGRIGRRFAPRFWEAEATLGRDKELFVIVCKKWHVAKRLSASIRYHTDIPAIDYLFNEEQTDLPDLGGIQTTLAKRTRHRRSLMKMLFDYYESNKLVICLDSADIDLLEDFFSDRSRARLLEIECEFTDDYLIGHAKRVGLAAPDAGLETLGQVIPTIRYDIAFESERIQDGNFEGYHRIQEDNSQDENAEILSSFLDVPSEVAQNLSRTPYLFDG